MAKRRDISKPTLSDPKPDSNAKSPTSPLEWLALAGLLVVGLALRAWATTGQSFTADETSELNDSLSQANLVEILDGASRFPFLYHLLLRGWLIVFTDPANGRWFSIVVGLATITIVWRLARRIAGPAVGLATAFLATLSPLLIWYSTEIRMYGLFLLFAALTLLAFIRLLQEPSSTNWALYVAAGAGGLFTHYWFPLVLISTLPFLLMSGAWREARRGAYGAALAFATLAIPWGWSLIQDIGGDYGFAAQNEFGVGPLGYTYFSFVSGYTLGPSLRELHTLTLQESLGKFAPFLALAIPAVAVLAWAGYQQLRGTRWPSILATLIVAPVLVVGLASMTDPLGFNVRYAVWVVIPFLVWLGAGIFNRENRLLVIPAIIVIAALSALALYNRTEADSHRNEDSAAVAEFLQTTASTGELFVSVNYMAPALVIQMPETWTIRDVPTVSQEGSGLDQALATIQSAATEEVWIAYTREFHGDPGGHFLAALLEMGAERVRSYAGIAVYVLKQ